MLAHALQIVLTIVSVAPSDQLPDPLTLDQLNAAIAARNLSSNATALSQRVIRLNATLLSECAPGFYRDDTVSPVPSPGTNLSAVMCLPCDCTHERWVARPGGILAFAPLDPSVFPGGLV